MSPWSLAWRLARYRPGLFAAAYGAWVLFYLVPLGTGLATRAVFDALAGGAPAGLTVWTALALFVGIESARISILVAAGYVWQISWLTMETLLRRNLLAGIVTGPGSRALPDSTGDAVSRFREDVEEALNFLDTWLDLSGEALFALVALAIMADRK